MTLPLSYSRLPLSIDNRRFSIEGQGIRSLLPPNPLLRLPAIVNRKLIGGQGRVRTSVDHKGRQIYSLLPLTAQPPVRILPTALASTGRVLRSAPKPVSFEPSGSRMRWARTRLLARAFLNYPDLVNPLPNLLTGDRLPDFLRRA